MPDPSGPASDDPTPLDRVRRSATVLQALLLAEAILLASSLLQTILQRLGVPWFWSPGSLNGFIWLFMLATGVSFIESLLWAWWVNRLHDAMCAAGAGDDGDDLNWLWMVAVLPCVGVLVRLVVVWRLMRRAEPSRLPPVVEERDRPGGFRDDPVTRGVSPGPARRRVSLWWALCVIVSTPLVFLCAFQRPGWFLSLAVLSALSGRMLVSGVTANLGELTRRHRHQRASGAG